MTKEKRKVYNKNYYIANTEKIKACNKNYYLTHQEEKKAYHSDYSKGYNLKHNEKIRARSKAYYLANKEKRITYIKNYNLVNKEKASIYIKKYQQTPKGKQIKLKARAKRRQFGFIPLNSYFTGSEGHHIDRQRVIYIPQELHKSISHGLLQNRNMEAINARALEFLQTNTFKAHQRPSGAMSLGKELPIRFGVPFCA